LESSNFSETTVEKMWEGVGRELELRLAMVDQQLALDIIIKIK